MESMDMEYNVSNLTIKVEPKLEDFEIENVPLEIIKNDISEEINRGPILLLQLADQTRLKNVLLDHSYCTTFCGYDEHGNTPYHETIQLVRVKHDASFENWTIKNEELDIKEEDLEEGETSLAEPRVKQTAQTNTKSKPEPEFVQLEQLNIAERNGKFVVEHSCRARSTDLDRISSSVCQNRLDTLRHRLEKNHQYETQASRISSSKKLLLRHMNPEEVKKFKCSRCKYQTFRKDNLKQHLLSIHMKINMFKCSQCEYRTLDKCSLNRHLLRHTNPEEVKKFKCSQCEYQTVQKSNLKHHLLRHMNPEEVKTFKCSQCEYRTLNIAKLKQHLLWHLNPEEVKKFKCSQCEYRTFDKGNLNRHLLRHMNPEEVKKFKCSQCAYRTFNKGNLNRHFLGHMNPEEVKKFKCSQCGYQTFRKDYLKRHLLCHESGAMNNQ